jgi:hypothetical protein
MFSILVYLMFTGVAVLPSKLNTFRLPDHAQNQHSAGLWTVGPSSKIRKSGKQGVQGGSCSSASAITSPSDTSQQEAVLVLADIQCSGPSPRSQDAHCMAYSVTSSNH